MSKTTKLSLELAAILVAFALSWVLTFGFASGYELFARGTTNKAGPAIPISPDVQPAGQPPKVEGVATPPADAFSPAALRAAWTGLAFALLPFIRAALGLTRIAKAPRVTAPTVPPAAKPSPSDSCERRLEQMTRRKDQYKLAFAQLSADLASLSSASQSAMGAVHRLSRLAAIMACGAVMAIMQLTSSAIASYVLAAEYPAKDFPNGTSGIAVPWYLDFLQSLLATQFGRSE